jgi:NhaP-type Na+/H+ and K+/H+ antiporter
MEVLSLLENKNRCLQRFLEVSTHFLGEAQAGDFAHLISFQSKRARILKTIELYDRKIDESAALARVTRPDETTIASIRALIQQSETLVAEILRQDDQILLTIEKQKNQLIADLQSTAKSQSQIARFKSHWVPPAGEELDEKL